MPTTVPSRKVALITGASSGIGREFARIHAARGGDVILVARSKEKLEELKEELERSHGIAAKVVAADLARPEAAAEVHSKVAAAGIKVECLINNAGFGGYGLFHERDWKQDSDMIQVNIVALASLTRLFLPAMVERRSGMILNVASTAGFVPGPLQAVYFATKAFVVSFSQALAEELSGTGVTVTVLCPGATDTGFAGAANLEGAPLFDKMESAESVAGIGYEAMLRKKLVAFNDRKLALFLRGIVPFLPDRIVLKTSRRLMEKKG